MKYHIENTGRRRKLWWDCHDLVGKYKYISNGCIIFWCSRPYYVGLMSWKNSTTVPIKKTHDLDDALHTVQEMMKC